MNWQPGLPVVTAADHAEWQAQCKARKLEQQRERRRMYPRIDYYPSEAAHVAILERTGPCVGGDLSSVIDQLILRALDQLPE